MESAFADPYESVYVGQLAYSLGFLAGSGGLKSEANCCALFANSPADQTFGDLVFGWQGKFFLLEAKRNERSVRTEYDKPHRREWLELLKGQPAWAELSERMHFVAFGEQGRFGEQGTVAARILVMSYGHLVNASDQASEKHELGQFLTDRLPKGGGSREEFNEYVVGLRRCVAGQAARSGAAPSRSSMPVSATALVMNYDARQRSLAFAMLDLSRDLERSIDPPERDLALSQRRGRDFGR